MSIETELQRFISEGILLDEGNPVGPDDPLMSSGRVDSMGLLKIVVFLQEKYGVDVLASGSPEDFETVSALAATVRAAQGGSQ